MPLGAAIAEIATFVARHLDVRVTRIMFVIAYKQGGNLAGIAELKIRLVSGKFVGAQVASTQTK